jgi:acyl-homoserine lactone acylase PvdQ
VKGRPAISVELKFTRHGPLICVEKVKNRAFAVRTIWLEPGTSPYFPAYNHMRSKTFEDCKKSVERWGTPSLNHVYADVQGNIGWAPRGFAPGPSELGWFASGARRWTLRVDRPLDERPVSDELQSLVGLRHDVQRNESAA